MEIKKDFDAVKWVREIRDKFYEDHKNLKGKDYINAIKKEIKGKTKSKRKLRAGSKKKELA